MEISWGKKDGVGHSLPIQTCHLLILRKRSILKKKKVWIGRHYFKRIDITHASVLKVLFVELEQKLK